MFNLILIAIILIGLAIYMQDRYIKHKVAKYELNKKLYTLLAELDVLNALDEKTKIGRLIVHGEIKENVLYFEEVEEGKEFDYKKAPYIKYSYVEVEGINIPSNIKYSSYDFYLLEKMVGSIQQYLMRL